MLLGIHNASFSVLKVRSGFSVREVINKRIADTTPHIFEDAQQCRYTPSMHKTPTHDSSLLCLQIAGAGGVTLLGWVRDPRLLPFLSLTLAIPISPHLPPLHNDRGESTLFLCRHGWITCFFFFLLTTPPFSSFIFEGITHCFSVSPEPPQTGTGRHRFENAVFISPPHRHSKRMWQPQYQLLIFTAIFVHANMLCYFYLLTSLVEESWEGLCNNIHWSGLTNLLLPPDPWPVHCLFARIGSLRRGVESWLAACKERTALFQGVKQIGTQNIYTLFRI